MVGSTQQDILSMPATIETRDSKKNYRRTARVERVACVIGGTVRIAGFLCACIHKDTLRLSPNIIN